MKCETCGQDRVPSLEATLPTFNFQTRENVTLVFKVENGGILAAYVRRKVLKSGFYSRHHDYQESDYEIRDFALQITAR